MTTTEQRERLYAQWHTPPADKVQRHRAGLEAVHTHGYVRAIEDFRAWLYTQGDLTTFEADLVSEKMIPFMKDRGIEWEG